ncbi:hypothetical protein PUNSTDRAFT_71345 [Punctularia strigosozonata HHB-11173 SS5]|uniref:uncharacterized protein n=1 Tax=Punctularia strigosozonata (strain HHB-11173) TaxID=741275 RepID=UPI000441630E|nr:uncharacterized protein PUNSTDRAFT_71345 [Punctularia strigosozonata HHB-11173 SS5]EIN06972.1 hypothetical protein PUNSTDRAFT_71345 [Punctularia strigosozonata HHB-11173 SS5]
MLPPPRRDLSRERRRDVKRESSSSHSREPPDRDHAAPQSAAASNHGQQEEGASSTSDFVKKLFKMLEDPAIAHVVSWGPAGDCFVVKDMNEFTKSILPRMFKHSNFASFVRQLNKYDFHKVKNTDDNQFGEHSWTFRHPDFHADRPEALENIKRKVPTQRKSTGGGIPSSSHKAQSGSPGPSAEGSSYERISILENEVDRLRQTNDDTILRLRDLEARYETVLAEIVGFQRNMAQQDSVMKDLIQYFLKIESDAQRLVGAPYTESEVARASLLQMNEISRRAESAGMSFQLGGGAAHARERQEAIERMQELQRRAENSVASTSSAAAAGPSSSSSSAASGPTASNGMDGSEPFLMPSGAEQEGLQVFTVGSLLPRSQVDDPNGNWTFDAGGELMRPPSKLRVRRSTFVPGWAVPPRVLLVDDDAVTRRLSSKFLQVFGCTTDVAVDGVSAVNKMNLEKYDLVLMDIVMPKLDGVSATSLIRQFDHMTPIISMTSASKPNEIMTYYSSGMNDILPKPFSKEGLLEMLEKHLMHLKVFQQMSGKALNLPTTNPADAITDGSAGGGAGGASVVVGGKINPLQAFGMTEEQYAALLTTMVSEDSFGGDRGAGGMNKRALEMEMDDGEGRDGKRGRFEEVA